MGSTRIMTIDGGGVRGVIPTVLMQRLSREPGLGDWLGRVEFVAGTSTGGLVALMLAAGLDPQDDPRPVRATRQARVRRQPVGRHPGSRQDHRRRLRRRQPAT